MKFGVREIANVVFRAKTDQKIGNTVFKQGQPVFYLDSAKTSSMEGAATTVYATGGRGNTRLIAWEGEKTLTFTVEDALLSPVSFAMLSGAGVVKGTEQELVHFHQTTMATIGSNGVINLDDALEPGEVVCSTAPLYIMEIDTYGDLTGTFYEGYSVSTTANTTSGTKVGRTLEYSGSGTIPKDDTVMVDYYVKKKANTVSELQIDAGHFGGYFYVEADTLFRRQNDGKDLPANITLPNVKIQSNFTFSMAATGDPSTFTFTMDAFPGYTYFDRRKKVLCAIQIVDESTGTTEVNNTVFPHPAATKEARIEESFYDSVNGLEEGELDEPKQTTSP